MQRLTFNCTLLTDIVLSAKAATEGFYPSLDYIPGAKFLGLVAAQHYQLDDPAQTLDLFHNGAVRFGDAHPLIDGERALRVPASWAYPKLKGLTDSLYLYHELSDEKVKVLTADGVQLKQARGAYFTTGGVVSKVEQNFSIKSAYDSDKYRAEDSKMFGYFALKRSSKWQFYVDIDNPNYGKLIVDALTGKRRIGRSSSAQYGLIEIEKVSTSTPADKPTVQAGRIYLYAMSNLCFYDASGHNTLQPTVEQLKLPTGAKIIWEHSQIRSRLYQTWNKKRLNRNPDRQIIEKGSVFVSEIPSAIDADHWQTGIGAHRSEGLGQVLVNPFFLISKDEHVNGLQLASSEKEEQLKIWSPLDFKGKEDDVLLDFLAERLQQEEKVWDTDQKVNAFIADHKAIYSGVSASQWGQVRNISKKANSLFVLKKLLFDDKIGFFKSGQSAPIWRKKERATKIEAYLFPDPNRHLENGFAFIIKLATEMAKVAKNN